jgi:tRNA (guanine-N7-)-methyltransferase
VDYLEREKRDKDAGEAEGLFYDLKEVVPPGSREESIRFFLKVFGNDKPLVVEIGSGNGHFLVDYAKHHPGRNYTGTEILIGRAKRFTSKLKKRNMKNVIVFWGDARRFVWDFLYEDSVEEFIVMFPDPWPKKRHYKHRLLSNGFILMLYFRLIAGGKISVATDYEEYRDFIIREVGKVPGFRNRFSNGYSFYPEDYPKTLFEDRFKKEGKPIYYMQWVKEGDAGGASHGVR